jgi:poly(A) polymerase
VDKIFMKQQTWNDLFSRHSFFTNDYKYYLSITASSKTKEAEGVWSGLVESKLRHLVIALDRKPIIAVAHPFPKGFERIHSVPNEQAMEAVKNGSTQYVAKGTSTEMTDETKDAAHEAAAQNGVENADVPQIPEQKAEIDSKTVYTTTYYIGLELKPLEPGMNPPPPLPSCAIPLTPLGAARSLDISLDSQHFKSMCTSWPAYQPEVMDLAVTHVRK